MKLSRRKQQVNEIPCRGSLVFYTQSAPSHSALARRLVVCELHIYRRVEAIKNPHLSSNITIDAESETLIMVHNSGGFEAARDKPAASRPQRQTRFDIS